MYQNPLFIGADQPLRRDFGISHVPIGEMLVPVHARDVLTMPFFSQVEFSRADIVPRAELLVVPPLSGHFPVVLRDVVLGLLPGFRVYVMDWLNVRHVPIDRGSFGLDMNIACVLDTMKRLAPGPTVIALCQGGIPALAATALLARDHDPHTPAALILIAAPIDPLANPTRVVKLLRSRPITWFEANVITAVPQKYAGAGRPVYPAHLHLIPLWAYLTRRVTEGSEITAKVLFDDGANPAQFPFLDLYTSIMDLDGKFFLENTRIVFQDCLLREGGLRFQDEPVNLSAIKQTSLLTIEGELDDIAAPGQTGAAHAFCTSLPERLRHRIIVPGSGHFSLFYGDTWRRKVLPVIRSFCAQNDCQGSKVSLAD